ncbi:MAG: hypothetical protein K5756_06850 [Clostridiales bacterium]|nr:hypothetical protein [Clostridiales bacterium]
MKVWSYAGYANWFVDSSATCTQPGLRHAVCKDCGEKMFLSANTVKSYLDEIMVASGIHSRTELAVCASKLSIFSAQL